MSGLVPKLRFPQFHGTWEEVPLKQVSSFVTDRVGDGECVPYTVTSGIGLMSQDAKFGRTIAGNSLRSYIRLQKGDFAYNKSATKAFPEGYIARYREDEKAAVPNSIFTCFRTDPNKIDAAYLDYLFAGNLHGRWLRKFLTIGARAHGSLNVSDSDLMALPVPIPRGEGSQAEQRKIAECLTSLDELIAAEGRRLDALRKWKKALLQNLFPRERETTPRLRFPEFHNAGEWESTPLESILTVRDDRRPPSEIAPLYSLTIESGITPKSGRYDREFLVRDSAKKYKVVKPYDVVYNPANLRWGAIAVSHLAHDVVVSPIYEVLFVSGPERHHPRFVQCAITREEQIKVFAIKGQGTLLERIVVKIGDFLTTTIQMPPLPAEQQRIASCLGSLDTLITEQTKKLDTLKTHKQGLMQGLFPGGDSHD